MPTPAPVAIRGVITGVAPGSEHGFHVHEFGDCALPDFPSAGDHDNPRMDPHGRHLGDLPDIKAHKDVPPTAIIGKSLVVHARPDDHQSRPCGGSGDQIACGVISVDHL